MSKSIGSLEEIVLLIVIVLGDNAYAVTIVDEYEKQFGKSITIPAIHTVLRRHRTDVRAVGEPVEHQTPATLQVLCIEDGAITLSERRHAEFARRRQHEALDL